MPLTEERRVQAFQEALTPRQFIESMQTYRGRLKAGYAATEFRPEQLEQIKALPEKLKVLALVEESSGDTIFNLPILMKLADLTGKLDLSLLRRSANEDIAAEYLLRSGRNHLPTYIFYNSKGQELGTFIERPGFVTMLMAEWFLDFWKTYPDLPGYGKLPGQMPEESRLVLIDFFADKREPHRAEEAAAIVETIVEIARVGLQAEQTEEAGAADER